MNNTAQRGGGALLR